MTTLSAEQSDLVRGAALGAMALVSKSDPGFFAMFKESMAGAKALATAPPEIRELLGTGFVAPPTGAGQDLEGAVVSQLQQARDMLAVTAPELLDGFRGVVLAACQATAEADNGVSDAERATIISSQLPISSWYEFIGDPTMADAILDRVIHNAYKIELKGPSKRKNKQVQE